MTELTGEKIKMDSSETCNACSAKIEHLRGNFKVNNEFVNQLDRRVIMIESNYSHITDTLGKMGDVVNGMMIKIDNLKDIVTEKKIAKELKDKVKRWFYNGSLWIIGFIGIYDMAIKLFGRIVFV